MAAHSKDPTVVEYAAITMLKGKSPSASAKATAKKFNGTQNYFIGSAHTVDIDADELEEALWERLVGNVTASIPRIKPGKEHYALDGVLQQFKQKPTLRAELKRRVIEAVGGDPFPHDEVK